MKSIMNCLWFDNQAEEAANLYTSIFSNSKILRKVKYATETPSNKLIGSIMSVYFQINGQEFMALNGGPEFHFNEAISFVINCDTQEEIDTVWSKLSAVPESEVCGWLKDKYGVSWQIVPTILPDFIGDPDNEKAKRVFEVILKSKKLNIAELQEAYQGNNTSS